MVGGNVSWGPPLGIWEANFKPDQPFLLWFLGAEAGTLPALHTQIPLAPIHGLGWKEGRSVLFI